MRSVQETQDELAVLMDLRLAFGPGTRVWASRSLEELCYDWLKFKSRRIDANFRDFADLLLAIEKDQGTPRMRCDGLVKRVASVLRDHRIRRRPVAFPGRVDLPHATNGAPSLKPDSFPELPVFPIKTVGTGH
jgi:hypothetical protein